MHLLKASFLLLILMPPSPRAHMINSMFVGVRLCVVEVVGIRGICVFANLGKDVESLPVHVPYSLMDN